MPTDAAARSSRIIESLDEISAGYDVLLCDLWGCLHNGVEPYPAAVAALEGFRARGGSVILVTNAPRASEHVLDHLANMGAPATAWDAAVSSGDATRAAMASGRYGAKLHVVGPPKDEPLWQGVGVTKAPLGEADAILCSGLYDDASETPEDYAEMIAEGVARGMPLLCANPDIVVDRGETRLFCAGAIAAAYTAAGGTSLYFGKPHAPIYALAMAKAAELRGGPVGPDRVLAVGDGIATDVLGASQAGLAAMFVGGGLAAAEVGDDPETPDPRRLSVFLSRNGASPAYTIGRLR